MPNLRLRELQSGKSFARLVEEHRDTSAFHRLYPGDFVQFFAYLDRHGLPLGLQTGCSKPKAASP